MSKSGDDESTFGERVEENGRWVWKQTKRGVVQLGSLGWMAMATFVLVMLPVAIQIEQSAQMQMMQQQMMQQQQAQAPPKPQ